VERPWQKTLNLDPKDQQNPYASGHLNRRYMATSVVIAARTSADR